MKEVLVEENIGLKSIRWQSWIPKTEGIVLAETDNRYLVKTGWFTKEWIPKDGPYQRCRVITKL